MALSTIKTIPTSIPGTPFFASFQGTTTPGTPQVLISFTVPNTITTRNLYILTVVCQMNGKFVFTVGPDVVGSGRTGAAEQNAVFQWLPPFPAVPGDVIQLTYTAYGGDPVTQLDAYLDAADL